jgi:hypothetical protein
MGYPLHFTLSTTSTTAFENPLDQELIRLDAIRVGDGEVEAQAVTRNFFASTSVLKVGETVVAVGKDSIRGDAKRAFPLIGQLVSMVLLGDS